MKRLVAIKNTDLSQQIKLQMKELMGLINSFDLEDEDEKTIVNNSRNRLKALLDQLNSGNVQETIEEIKDIAEDITENVDIDISDNMEIDNIVEDIEDNVDANDLTEEDQFIQQCENSGKFNNYQMEAIREGFEKNLTIEQVKVYAKPEFGNSQMEEIRYGFESGLTMEQVKLYAKPEFDYEQMDVICLGFKDGLTMEQVKFYADPKFDSSQMAIIFDSFVMGLSIDQIKTFARPEIYYEDMDEIRKKIRNKMFEPFKMSFSNGFDKNKAIKFIQNTNKPIKYTYGLKYRNPTTYLKPISKDKAIEIIEKGGLLDIKEYDDYIDLNEFSDNDMW